VKVNQNVDYNCVYVLNVASLLITAVRATVCWIRELVCATGCIPGVDLKARTRKFRASTALNSVQ
jgi:hypothetical protein